MNQFNLYIGADNKTGQVDKDKIVSYLTHVFDGFSIMDSIGLWKGTKESSVVVTIFTDKNRWFMVEFIKGLCSVLKQDCIIMQSMIAEESTPVAFSRDKVTMRIDFLPPTSIE